MFGGLNGLENDYWRTLSLGGIGSQAQAARDLGALERRTDADARGDALPSEDERSGWEDVGFQRLTSSSDVGELEEDDGVFCEWQSGGLALGSSEHDHDREPDVSWADNGDPFASTLWLSSAALVDDVGRASEEALWNADFKENAGESRSARRAKGVKKQGRRSGSGSSTGRRQQHKVEEKRHKEEQQEQSSIDNGRSTTASAAEYEAVVSMNDEDRKIVLETMKAINPPCPRWAVGIDWEARGVAMARSVLADRKRRGVGL